MAAWSVYMVRCADGTLYSGATTDVAARVAAHNAGRGARYTRSRRPVRLVYARWVGPQGAALRAEWRLKQRPRDEKLALAARWAARRAGARKRRGPGDVR